MPWISPAFSAPRRCELSLMFRTTTRLGLRHHRFGVDPAELRLPVLEGLARLDLVVVLRVVGFPPALEVPDDGRGVERGPVVELDPAAKLEGPDPAVPRHVPPLGQRRLDLGGRPLVPHEPVEDLPGDAGRDPVGDDCWIQLHGLTLSAEHEGLAERRTRGDVEGDGDEERERCEPHWTGPPQATEAWEPTRRDAPLSFDHSVCQMPRGLAGGRDASAPSHLFRRHDARAVTSALRRTESCYKLSPTQWWAVKPSHPCVPVIATRAPTRRWTMSSLVNLDRILRQAVESKAMPGVVAVAATDTEVLYEGAFGKRDLGKPAPMTLRSEERRVGKECRSRWSPYH